MGMNKRRRLDRRSDPENSASALDESLAECSDTAVEHHRRPDTPPTQADDLFPELSATNSVKETIGMRIRQTYSQAEIDELIASPTYKTALGLIQHLLADSRSFMFAKPVNELWSEDELPGYFDIVKKPMDLGTILQNLTGLEYTIEKNDGTLDFDDLSFQTDVRLVFRNCMRYNDKQSDYYRNARRLLARADRRFIVRPEHLPPSKASEQTPAQDPSSPKPKVETPEPTTLIHNEEQDGLQARTSSSRLRGTIAGQRKAAHQSSVSAQEVGTTSGKEADQMEERVVDVIENSGKLPVMPSASGSRIEIEPSNPSEPAVAVHPRQKHGETAAVSGSLPASQKRRSKWSNTSSVSSDEQEAAVSEPAFAFVSTSGMEKRRGRKSAFVQDLETKHEQLLKRRKLIVDSASALEQLQRVEMTFEEKEALCNLVSALDFIQMKGVVDIISRGMNRFDILKQEEVEMDIDDIDNKVLREVQAFLNNSAMVAAHGTLRSIDDELAEIETQIVALRYQKIA